MNAKRYLLKIRRLYDEIENKTAERNKLFSDAVYPSAINYDEHVKTFVNGNRTTEIIEKCADLDKQIQTRLEQLDEIIKTLELLDDIEYNVIHKMYVQGMSRQTISKKIHYSRSQIFRIEQSAIAHLQEILDYKEGAVR